MIRDWYICILLFAMAITSCNGHDSPVPEEDYAVSISLVLSMPESGLNNRLASYESESFGNEYYISPNDIEVLIYDENGDFKAQAEMPEVTPVDGVYHQYFLTCKLSDFNEDDFGKMYKIVVLANMAGHTKVNFPATQLSNMKEETLYRQMTIANNNGYDLTTAIVNKYVIGRIPMWGSITTEISVNNMAEIDLMRAMAKVEIGLSSELMQNNQRIVYAGLRGGQTMGYITPKDAEKTDHTIGTYVSGQDYTDINIPTSSEGTMIDIFVELSNGNYVLYIPEQPANINLNEQGLRVEISINENLTVEDNYTLYFASPDVNGKLEAFPILRNHYYKINITNVAFKHELEYEVVDWTRKEIDVPAFE